MGLMFDLSCCGLRRWEPGLYRRYVMSRLG